MPFNVQMYFDEATDKTICQIWKALEDKGLRPRLQGYQPHITLGGAIDETAEDFKTQLSALVKAEPAPQVTLSSLDTFDTPEGFVLFFKGRATPELLDFHSRFDSLLEKFAQELGEYYRPGRWTPHCTLTWGLSNEQLSEAKEICQSYTLPMVGHFVRVAIVEVPSREKSLECSFATREG